ncbi:MAG TPA: hypothetical protein ACN46S_09140 [Prochlorococcus sp.]|tara:strand:+ start:138 stop:347 length:210 start_codon:yes stop_codon:yes gene_type:complete
MHSSLDQSASALGPTLRQSRPDAGNSGYLPFEVKTASKGIYITSGKNSSAADPGGFVALSKAYLVMLLR